MTADSQVRKYLWPHPRRMRTFKQRVTLPNVKGLRFESPNWPTAAAQAQRMMRSPTYTLCEESEVRAGKRTDREFKVLIQRDDSPHGPDWYSLRLDNQQALIRADDIAGVRNACATLKQLFNLPRKTISAIQIEDWPDFPVRGVMLDISRDKVPTMNTLLALIELYAGWKFNQLQLYIEHTFKYAGHESVWRGSSALSASEIKRLDQHCRSFGIELVPNQNSLGHMERWLKHKPYRQLAETLEPWQTPWGETRDWASTLCPIDPGSIRLMRDLYDQLLPHFQSRLFNVGCDEPFELGQGRSKRACRQRGQGHVYLSYLKRLNKLVRGHGHRMQFWADWLLHYPDLVPKLPRDVMPMIWGYEVNHPFMKECAAIQQSGLDFYVCPGTSSWCSIAGRTDNMLNNIRRSAAAGRKHGACGLLVTDWGDFGHHQVLPVSLPGFAWAAGQSWCARQNADASDLGPVLDQHVFNGRKGVGAAWLDAGRVHEIANQTIHNRSILFSLLVDDIGYGPKATLPTLTQLQHMKRSIAGLLKKSPSMSRVDSVLADEWRLTLTVMTHACERGLKNLKDHPKSKRGLSRVQLEKNLREIITLHEAVWRRRNRPGGLKDSTGRYRKLLNHA